MIVLGVKLDGIYGFDHFEIDFTYPKKIVNSLIDDEYLEGRERFRYKKAVVLMGANATGKTSLGKALNDIFNLFQFGFSNEIYEMASEKEAHFSIDFVHDGPVLHRYEGWIYKEAKNYAYREMIAEIGKNDSYEMCLVKLKEIAPQENADDRYSHKKLNHRLYYRFSVPGTRNKGQDLKQKGLLRSLKAVLGTLDPSLTEVAVSHDLANSFIVRRGSQEIIIQDGKLLNGGILSSGTKEGVDIAILLASIMNKEPGFYYCDERFSYIQSDLEKRIFGLMLDHLPSGSQLIFTTHNTDMLDLNLPKHSYMFLRKRKEADELKVDAISGSDYLKRNTDSMRSAVENDVFSSLPDDTLLNELEKE
ncbi:MAG: ATP-binding protein [Erysipelotrichaceae bacterium]|nr:ATP-binding protein [Erysipelotrichaceae bacterium]